MSRDTPQFNSIQQPSSSQKDGNQGSQQSSSSASTTSAQACKLSPWKKLKLWMISICKAPFFIGLAACCIACLIVTVILAATFLACTQILKVFWHLAKLFFSPHHLDIIEKCMFTLTKGLHMHSTGTHFPNPMEQCVDCRAHKHNTWKQLKSCIINTCKVPITIAIIVCGTALIAGAGALYISIPAVVLILLTFWHLLIIFWPPVLNSTRLLDFIKQKVGAFDVDSNVASS